jgi:hypothetical protein
MMRREHDAAAKALAEGEDVGMMREYKELKGFNK